LIYSHVDSVIPQEFGNQSN